MRDNIQLPVLAVARICAANSRRPTATGEAQPVEVASRLRRRVATSLPGASEMGFSSAASESQRQARLLRRQMRFVIASTGHDGCRPCSASRQDHQ
jgi:hypothetical protein